MTDEKKPAGLEATGAIAGNQQPDELRRRLAKAALVSPVVMMLAPRRILAQDATLPGCADSGGALLTSLAAAGNSYTCVATPDESTPNPNDYILSITRANGTTYECTAKKNDIDGTICN